MSADAQEVECANWSTLHANYCFLNRCEAAERSDQARRTSVSVRKCVLSDSASTVSNPPTHAAASAESGIASLRAPTGGGKKREAVRGNRWARPSTAPGSEIQGLVAVVESQRLLLKLNLGDPRLIAIADRAEASACLHRSRASVPMAFIVNRNHAVQLPSDRELSHPQHQRIRGGRFPGPGWPLGV